MTDLIEGLKKVYAAARVTLPQPRAISLRLIEEVVELCLACGASPADIHSSVHNAMHREHAKHPEQSFNEGIVDAIQIPGEIADVSLLTDFCRHLAHITDGEVADAAEFKVERLAKAQEQGNLKWTEDGRFYRTKVR